MVTLSVASGKQVTVSYATTDGTAEASEDYTAVSSTTLLFAAGDTKKTIEIATTEDTRNEDEEAFTVTLSSAENATLAASGTTATGTIADDDGEPELSLAGVTVSEGDPAQFVVTLSVASGKQVTVSYATTDGTAEASEDYTAVSSTTLLFAAGDTKRTIEIATTEDTRNEDEEAFTVTLSSAENATLAASGTTATGTIADDDGEPELSLAGVTVRRRRYGAVRGDAECGEREAGDGELRDDGRDGRGERGLHGGVQHDAAVCGWGYEADDRNSDDGGHAERGRGSVHGDAEQCRERDAGGRRNDGDGDDRGRRRGA